MNQIQPDIVYLSSRQLVLSHLTSLLLLCLPSNYTAFQPLIQPLPFMNQD